MVDYTTQAEPPAPHYSVFLRACDVVNSDHGAQRPFGLTKLQTIKVCVHSLVRALEGHSYSMLVIGDGLSSQAVQNHAAATAAQMLARLAAYSVAPIVIAEQARVALSDEIGERLGARAVVMLIGERPGLSTPDSLGVYITFAPRRGRTDADRNCISNIHASGLSYAAAADKTAWLLGEAFRLGFSGVALKDQQGAPVLPGAPQLPA